VPASEEGDKSLPIEIFVELMIASLADDDIGCVISKVIDGLLLLTLFGGRFLLLFFIGTLYLFINHLEDVAVIVDFFLLNRGNVRP
jgi:hypothetical protein